MPLPLCCGSDPVYDPEHEFAALVCDSFPGAGLWGWWVYLNVSSTLFTWMTRRFPAWRPSLGSSTRSPLTASLPVPVSSCSGQGLWSPHWLHVCLSASHATCHECCGPHPQHMSQVDCSCPCARPPLSPSQSHSQFSVHRQICPAQNSPHQPVAPL